MILKKLEITGLFECLNHSITFKDDKITIITAPNGCGKTICLKIIDAIFNHNFKLLANLKFDEITLHVNDDIMSITQEISNEYRKINFRKFGSRGKFSYKLDNKREMTIRRYVSNKNIKTNFWEQHGNIEKENQLSIFDLMDEYDPLKPSEIKKYPSWFEDITNSLNVYFIQDQRIIKVDDNTPLRDKPYKNYINTIEEYSKKLSHLMRETELNAAQVARKLDSTFPERLIGPNKSHSTNFTKDRLNSLLGNLNLLINELSRFGLESLKSSFIYSKDLSSLKTSDIKTLSLYAIDTIEKLEAYMPLYTKIALFSQILDGKTLAFKNIRTNKDKGFYFESKNGETLDLNVLSSGEKHQIVLLFELIFMTGNNSLILIDEPEISLHVAWQKEFLSDLKSIIEDKDINVVIATHSPQIINDNWDLTVSLSMESAL